MKINNNKGITMISLVTTVVLMAVILSTIAYSATTSLKIKSLNNMYSDIRILDEKIAIYYLKYGTLPISGNSISFEDSINPNDNEKYYRIKLDNLEGVSLSNASDYVYIINEQSHTIYYQSGVEVGDTIYYTIPLIYTKVE